MRIKLSKRLTTQISLTMTIHLQRCGMTTKRNKSWFLICSLKTDQGDTIKQGICPFMLDQDGTELQKLVSLKSNMIKHQTCGASAAYSTNYCSMSRRMMPRSMKIFRAKGTYFKGDLAFLSRLVKSNRLNKKRTKARNKNKTWLETQTKLKLSSKASANNRIKISASSPVSTPSTTCES